VPDIEDAGIAATPLGGQVDEAERQRRDFIRAHHPDRGGDPDIFVAGLRSFSTEQERSRQPRPRVVAVRHRARLTRMVIAVTRRLCHRKSPPRVH
jgi:NADH dehydrogenase FAD-containing subunit